MRLRLLRLLLGLTVAVLTLAPTQALAQGELPALAINQSIGTGGTQVGFTGVAFTPGGRVTVALTPGAGLAVAEVTASATGSVTGSFAMPANVPGVGTAGRVSVFAIDRATGRETLSAFFVLTTSPPLDYDLPDGHFFTQTNGLNLGAGTGGFSVVNARPFVVPVRFFSEFQRLGGVALLGFPISQPFVLDGFVTQVFQKAVFQWRPEVDQVFFINVFDVLHDRGFDPFLLAFRSTPLQLPPSFDAGKTVQQIISDRLALLDANPAIRATYFSVDDPFLRFGLPTSQVEDMGNHFAIRLQRAELQQWKVEVPWAHPGQVTIANGGAVAAEVGLWPAFALRPLPQPTFSRNIVVYQPGKGDRVSSGFLLQGEAQVFEAVVSFQLIGDNGTILSQGPVLATVSGPEFGRFATNVNFTVGREQPAVLRVFERSARDGSITPDTLVSIPLVVAP